MTTDAPRSGADHADRAEAARLIEACAAQLAHTQAEGEAEVAELLAVFTDLARGLGEIRSELVRTADDSRTSERCRMLESTLARAIIRLQFYDRLQQRLGNAQATLLACRELLDAADVGQSESPRQAPRGESARARLRATYTVAADLHLLDAVCLGASAEEAQACVNALGAKDIEDEPELF